MCNKRWLIVLLFVIIQSLINIISGQEVVLGRNKAGTLLSERGEIIIRFRKPAGWSFEEISRHISVDNYRNDTITAYASTEGFSWFTAQLVPFDIIVPPSLRMPAKKGRAADLNSYPSYPDYLEIMNDFAADYPGICRLIEFGSTVDGRKLLVLKISDFPDTEEDEPAVLYSSSMHGDEPLGYVIMLKLIDYLLQEYPVNAQIKDLIDHTEIWINPLANPDGAYFISDSSIYGAKRFNRNNIDLNRDFPKIPSDLVDSMQRQPETRNMMSFMKKIRPTLAANFHGGAEVVNYPWDTWQTDHPDITWYRRISRAYADTVHAHAPEGYMTFMNNGITKGIDWYQVIGSRQDYVNYYLYGREVTIELSDDKIPAEAEIEDYWNYNRNSLVQFMAAAHSGFRGTISDSASGNPLQARVRIIEHDRDNSFVFSGTDGNYFRPIASGNYHVVYSAPGYRYKIIPVSVGSNEAADVDVLLSQEFDLKLFPNPFRNIIKLNFPYSGFMLYITIMDLSGRKLKVMEYPVTYSGEHEIPVRSLAPGYYIIHMRYNNQDWQFKAIRLND